MKKKLFKAFVLTFAAVALVVASVVSTMAFLTSSAAVANTFTVGEVYIRMYESAVDANGVKVTNNKDANGMKTSAGNVYNLMPGNTYDKDPTIYVDAKSQASYLFLKVRNDIRSIEEGIVRFDIESISFVKDDAGNYTYAEVKELNRDDDTVNKIHKLVIDVPTGTGEGNTHQAPCIKVVDGKVFEYGTNNEIPLTMRAQMELKGWKYHHENANVVVYVYSYEPTNENLAKVAQAENYAQTVGGIGQRQDVDVFDRFTIKGDVTDMVIFGAARVSLVAYAVQASGFGEIGTEASVDAAWNAIVALYPYESGDGFSTPTTTPAANP